MKDKLKRFKKAAVILTCCAGVVVLGLHLVSYLYYHRSLMASFAEWYMMAIDRDAIYSDCQEYEDNLAVRAVNNLEDQTIPEGVSMDIPYTY